MKKVLKITGYTLLTLIVLIIIAAVIFIKNFDPNKYKPEISSLVKQHTGLSLKINGNIELSIFPWVGVKVNQIQLNNPPQFLVKSMAKIGEVDVKTKFLPLLEGKLEIKNITINNADINLVKLPTGVSNLDNLLKSAKTPQEKQAIKQAEQNIKQQESGYKPDMNQLNIAGFSIKNSDVNFINKDSGQDLKLSNVNVNASNIGLNKFFPLSVALSFSQNKPTRNVQLKINSQININLDQKYYQLKDLQLTGNLSQPGLKLPFSLTANATVKNNTISIPTFNAKVKQTKLSGNLNTTLSSQKKINFNLKADSFNANNFLGNSGTKSSTVKQRATTKVSSAKTAAFKWSRSPILPIDLLKNLNINGTINIQQLQYQKLKLSNSQVTLKTANKVLSMQLSSKVLKGTFSLASQLNLQKTQPRINLQISSNNIDISDVLSLVTSHDFLDGLGQYSTKLSLSGNSLYSWVNSLAGSGKFQLNKGVIKGIDFYYLGALGQALQQRKAPTQKNTDQTPFNQFKGSYQIQRGIISNNDLNIQAGRFSVTGKGNVNLPQQNINYNALLNFGPKVQIPVYVKGNLFNPKKGVNTDLLLKQLAQTHLKKAQKSITKKLESKVQNAAKKLFSGFKF